MKRKNNENRLEWLFFGLNHVLINPDKLCYNVYQLLQRNLRLHGIQLSFDEILSTREDLILGHDDEDPYLTIARMYLSKTDYQTWHRQVHDYYQDRMQKDLIIIPGMDDLIRQLSKQFSLGIIADQPLEILQFLDRKRLLSCFKIHAISGIVRMNKPRKKLFEWAVNQARSSFERCLMTGYRLNDDVIPAKQLDMMTIQTRWDIDKKGYQPKAKKPLQYLSSLRRIEVWSLDAGKADVAPDEMVTTVPRLYRAIQQFNS